MSARSFRYVQPLGRALLALLFFGGGAIFMLAMARSSAHRLRVFGMRLEPGETVWFETIIGILCAGFAVLGTLALLLMRGGDQQVIVDDAGITIPKTLFSRRVVVPWAEIESVGERQVKKLRFLQLRHRAGKSNLSERMLGEAAYAELGELIRARAPRSATTRP